MGSTIANSTKLCPELLPEELDIFLFIFSSWFNIFIITTENINVKLLGLSNKTVKTQTV